MENKISKRIYELRKEKNISQHTLSQEIGVTQKAIDFWMENKQIFTSCLSVPLLTSLAAAYCDVGNYELAKKCADRAYAIQGGSQNYQSELSLVYARIRKETKDY